MTANSQLLTTTPKTKTKANEANNQNRNRPQRWRSHGGLSAGEWEVERGERVQRISSISGRKWQVQNREGEVKNSIGNVEAKKLVCMTHGQELRGGERVGKCGWGGCGQGRWE